jgi:molybdopterin converting factor small subunit
MNVRVQFFSRLRDLVGRSDMELNLQEGKTVADLLEQLFLETPPLREWNGSILVAAGVEFVGRDYVPKAGDEISIMPPVQGG